MDESSVVAELNLNTIHRFNGEIRKKGTSHYLQLSSVVGKEGVFPTDILNEDRILIEEKEFSEIVAGQTVEIRIPIFFSFFNRDFLQQSAPLEYEKDPMRFRRNFLVYLRL